MNQVKKFKNYIRTVIVIKEKIFIETKDKILESLIFN